MTERRDRLRIGKWATISYTINRSFLKYGSRMTNISEGGICFPTIQRLDPGTILEMQIEIKDNAKPMRAVAKVIWSKERLDSRYPFESGLMFVDIDWPLKDQIKKLAAEISKIK